MTATAGEAFWSYSLAVYDRPGVADRLIEWQDRFGIDVNVVLFCCWCGWSGRVAIDDPAFATLLDAVATWRTDVVNPLRHIRRRMKQGVLNVSGDVVTEIRADVKRLEIDCERIEQVLLAERAPPASVEGSFDAARTLLDRYFTLVGLAEEVKLRASVDSLIAACSP